jgi:hypothetical protein
MVVDRPCSNPGVTMAAAVASTARDGWRRSAPATHPGRNPSAVRGQTAVRPGHGPSHAVPLVTALIRPSCRPEATLGSASPCRLPRARVRDSQPRGQGRAQLPLCDQPDSGHTGYFTTKVTAQQAIDALTACGRRRIPFHYRCGRPQRLRTATTSVSAVQGLCGAPRRNRTGDPILTMDRQPSAVLSRVDGTPVGGPLAMRVLVGSCWSRWPRTRRG